MNNENEIEEILSKQIYRDPVEKQVLDEEEAENTYNFKMRVSISLSTLRAEIYEMYRVNSMTTTVIVQDMRHYHGLNTNQAYYNLRETKKTEQEEAKNWDWLSQS